MTKLWQQLELGIKHDMSPDIYDWAVSELAAYLEDMKWDTDNEIVVDGILIKIGFAGKKGCYEDYWFIIDKRYTCTCIFSEDLADAILKRFMWARGFKEADHPLTDQQTSV